MAILEDIKMGSIRILISGYTLLIIFHHVHHGIASATKTKRCVKYRVQETRGKWNQTILGIVMNITESNCLVQCVRNEQCMAYNIWHGNNTCELLPQILKYGETEMQKGWSFVHLGDCTKDVPWITGRLDMVAGSPCLSWWYFDPISECPSKYLKTPNGKLCVTLTPQRGLYLPGWHRQRSQLVTLDGRPARCTSGYLLRVASSCSVVWRGYTAGNPVPKRAVVGGKWTDGTPLYIVTDYIKLRWIVGYYRPSIQRSFFMRTGKIYNPEDMKILLFN